MKASELIEALELLVDIHGDKEINVDGVLGLRRIEEIDLAAEDDDCFAIWTN